ncbi:MAG: hypothetical protein CEE43_09470 [Promethearchaeota archaeon Loki_b32]|nr:MAG: hypothetical protein CEE43_09470 [Candidatus Lokiarchaeota archaeon Loki_b32]
MSKDVGLVNHSCGSVLERYWLSSSGVAIVVEDDTPLMYSFNTSTMCFKADPTDSMYVNSDLPPKLSYAICTGQNMKDIHLYMMNKYLAKPEALPDERMIRQPIWSTWAKFKMFIDQNKTIEFATEIANHGFSGSQIEIDDKYTTTYGDFIFDPEMGPHARGVGYLNEEMVFLRNIMTL